MAETPKLTADEKTILRECLKRETTISDAPAPPSWKHWECRELDDQRRHGPAYAPADWFGSMSQTDRRQLLRVIRRLESAGLLTAHSRRGNRLSHIKLTPAGEKLAKSLQNDESDSGEPAAKPRAA